MEQITKDMLISDIIEINPNAGEILMSFGMGCIGCAIAHGETVEQAAMVHEIDIDELLKALND